MLLCFLYNLVLMSRLLHCFPWLVMHWIVHSVKIKQCCISSIVIIKLKNEIRAIYWFYVFEINFNIPVLFVLFAYVFLYEERWKHKHLILLLAVSSG